MRCAAKACNMHSEVSTQRGQMRTEEGRRAFKTKRSHSFVYVIVDSPVLICQADAGKCAAFPWSFHPPAQRGASMGGTSHSMSPSCLTAAESAAPKPSAAASSLLSRPSPSLATAACSAC